MTICLGEICGRHGYLITNFLIGPCIEKIGVPNQERLILTNYLVPLNLDVSYLLTIQRIINVLISLCVLEP